MQVKVAPLAPYTVAGTTSPVFAGAGNPSGAIAVLRLIPGVEIINGPDVGGFNIGIFIGAGVI
jgi:hypothetical protein